MSTVVKRAGHNERFDERKVYGSVYAACASAQLLEKECENIAEKTTKKINAWLADEKEVDSIEIRKKVKTELNQINSELAFFYEKHLPNLGKL